MLAQILTYLYVIAAVVLLFGAAVFVHEFGHYWVARKRGLKVEAFAIGFGPKIFGWTKDGIEYSWRWIPAGGYVKLPQMITSEAIEGTHQGEPLPPASPWSKILVAFAGPLMNVVFAFAIGTFIYFVGLPVPVNPSIIGYVKTDSPEGKLGIQAGDAIVEVDGKPTRSWEDVYQITALARTNVLKVVLDRAGTRSTYNLETRENTPLPLKVLNLNPQDHPVIFKVEPDGPADKAGLKTQDKFMSFAGIPVHSQEQLVDLIRKRGGEPSEVVVERNAQSLTLNVTPMFDPQTKRGRIGVGLSSGSIRYEVQKPGPTPWAQVKETLDLMYNTFSALVHSEQTGVGAKDLSGPVGILTIMAAHVKTDYRLALKFLVLLNINLAILNLLPIPVLDGGHIVMSVIEKIRQRPLSIKFVEYTTTACALALISFMLYVTFHDFRRFSLFKSFFQRETQIEQTPPPSPIPAPAPAPR
ncbi:MAG: RIP metalloprotease RseP [Verrucomicrobia bacterium]|nr:RIP metalloprotease RseP [Verrucomicrobiota bacterium]